MLLPIIASCLVCSSGIATYEAEDQFTSGIRIGPDRAFGALAAEASSRRAVLLKSAGQFIRLRLKAPARGLTVRYALPGPPDKGHRSADLVIEADGRLIVKARLSAYYLQQPVAHPVAPDFLTHHFWQEARILLPRLMSSGTTIVLRPASSGNPTPLAIDMIEAEKFETPGKPPHGAISVLRFGADPEGRKSARAAFIDAIESARHRHKVLFVPPGRYRVDGHLIVDRVAIVGAGSWYTIITGHHVGFYSRAKGSKGVMLSKLAVESDVAQREDRLPLAAVGGTFSNSSFEKLYLHRAKVGMWLDGPAHDLLIDGVEIADQTADGINFHRGIRDATVRFSRIRNVGDDGIASWSDETANRAISIRSNSVEEPGLANGIAIYGGHNIKVVGNRIADVLNEGGGIHLGARFHSAPFSGSIVVEDNLIVRSGTLDPHWHFGVGAIWIYALERPIEADIRIVHNRIEDAACEAVQLLGPERIDGVVVDGLQIRGPVTSIFALQTSGRLVAKNVVTAQSPSHPIVETPANFELNTLGGNRGWSAQRNATPDLPSCN